ncbi:DnaJ-like protein subfamily B member 4 [Nematocida parisii]|uniref:J domain-containing protein n=1 Tax=Nematocida parisii (strain ERTm3) TaxID=935791 RepID=I3EFP1_NEMP3|nr:uncharacterized protein NEPG_01468 [Nematocida parisii ERTm1]EIJ88038.1 hypothetical protein NEQG_01482 [Nematocida parisii ERTm3]KAI5128435.1 DnaJ-like protein subfamily B member 4 [Nematocida parisii]EIJ93896.1 hypothetical protein NEPG_01468 [Nematocida parisii ERTm1]KAI5128478.1 DnaJ-like protein subfamily B member 4 [Nematocida parisii]KAI5144524.1 DnaJ-like protein subfamily B member 4 [Nematocida parisii]|eukprot:XP_013059296.1 hypothetical protein NEPG_01468 [Nematocida parisii ERTm1]
MAEKKSLYEILNVPKTATESEIRKAYKTLAKKYHPDRHTNKSEKEQQEMQEKFKELNNAHEILTNKNKREFYDHTGMTEEEAAQSGYGRAAGGAHGFPGGFGFKTSEFDFSDFSSMGGSGGGFHGFSDFGSMFGGAGGFESMFGGGKQRTAQRQTAQANKTFEYKLPVSLEDICNGVVKQLKINRNTMSGGREQSLLDVNILPGYKYGTKITYKNAGDYYADGTGTDVIVILTEKPHPIFKLSNSDIIYDMDVSIKEYLAGISRTIKGLKNNTITINNRIIGDNSKPAVIPEEGIPDRSNGSKRGSLIIKTRIIMDITPQERQAISNVLL